MSNHEPIKVDISAKNLARELAEADDKPLSRVTAAAIAMFKQAKPSSRAAFYAQTRRPRRSPMVSAV